jgi:hypothetical protein
MLAELSHQTIKSAGKFSVRVKAQHSTHIQLSARHGAVSFRRSIKFVTCKEQKSPNGSYYVSSIGSAFSSPIAESSEKQKNGEKVTNGNLTPIQMLIDGCPKKLMLDPRGTYHKSHPNCDLDGWNLAQVSTHIFMSRKLSPLEEVLKALQSIVQERPGGNPKNTKTKGCAIVEEYVPIGMTPPTTDLLVTSMLKSKKTDQIPW